MVDTTDLAEAWAAFRAARRDYVNATQAITARRARVRATKAAPFDFDAELESPAADDPLQEDALEQAKYAAEDAVWAAVSTLEQAWAKHGLHGQYLAPVSKR